MKNLTKQTVYLPVKEDYGIYLGNFLGYPDGYSNEGNLQKQELFVFTPEQLNEYTANVIDAAMADTNSIQKCSNAGYESKIQELQNEIAKLKFDRNELVSDVIKQTLEVAAEKAISIKRGEPILEGYRDLKDKNNNTIGRPVPIYSKTNFKVDKKSITNSFKEIYNKLKV